MEGSALSSLYIEPSPFLVEGMVGRIGTGIQNRGLSGPSGASSMADCLYRDAYCCLPFRVARLSGLAGPSLSR